MDETDALRSKRCNEDAISLAPSTTESIIVEGELTDWGRDWISTVPVLVEIVMVATLFFSACSVEIYAFVFVQSDSLSLGSLKI